MNNRSSFADYLPMIFLILGVIFGACVIVFANANTETLTTYQTFGPAANTAPVDETTNGAYYGEGVFGAAVVSAACFIAAAITSRRRVLPESRI